MMEAIHDWLVCLSRARIRFMGLGAYRLSKDLEQFTQEQIAEKINWDFEPDKEEHISWFEIDLTKSITI